MTSVSKFSLGTRAGAAITAAVLSASLVLVLFAGPAGAQEDPYNPSSISILDPEVCAGEPATAVAQGTPGQTLVISFAGQSSSVVAGANGQGSASFTTTGMAPGQYAFVVSNGANSASAPLFIRGGCNQPATPAQATPPPSGGTLSSSSSRTPPRPPTVLSAPANVGSGILGYFNNIEVLGRLQGPQGPLAFSGTNYVAPLAAGGVALAGIGLLLVRVGRRQTVAG